MHPSTQAGGGRRAAGGGSERSHWLCCRRFGAKQAKERRLNGQQQDPDSAEPVHWTA